MHIFHSVFAQKWAVDEQAYRSFRDTAFALPTDTILSRMGEVKAMYGMDEDAVETKPSYFISEVRDGVGIIPIRGMLLYEATWLNRLMAWFFDGTVMQDAMADFDRMLGDEAVNQILFKVNSGGGHAVGCEAFSEKIFQARGVKDTVTHCDELMASAAYYIGSATDKVYATKDAMVGSIGTLISWLNYDGMMEQMGIKEILIVSKYSPDKVPDENTPEGLALYQDVIDKMGLMFVDAVARNRGTNRKDVLKNYGAGWMKLGDDALSAGMIDGIASFDTVFEALSQGKELPQKQAQSQGEKMSKANYESIGKKMAAFFGFEPDGEDEPNTVATVQTPVVVVAAQPDERDKELADLRAQLAAKDASEAAATKAATDATRKAEADAFVASLKGKVPVAQYEAMRLNFEAAQDNEAASAAMKSMVAALPDNPLLARVGADGENPATVPADKPSEAEPDEVDEAAVEAGLRASEMGRVALAKNGGKPLMPVGA